MKYIILPWFMPIVRFIAAIFILIVRLIIYVFAAFIDLWNWNTQCLTERWNSDFYDARPEFIFPGRTYKVFLTFKDYVLNKPEIRYA